MPLTCTDALERDWLTSTSPMRLAQILEHTETLSHRGATRKVRLFAAACCRGVLTADMDPRIHQGCQMAELYCCGRIGDEDLMVGQQDAALAAARLDAGSVHCGAAILAGIACSRDLRATRDAIHAITLAVGEQGLTPAIQAAYLRDLFGSPIRLPRSSETDGWLAGGTGSQPRGPAWDPVAGSHADQQVRLIAQTIATSRRYRDFPQLGLAIEQAGCTDEEILRHCLGGARCAVCLGRRREGCQIACTLCGGEGWHAFPGTHARGCWVLDLLLGF